MSGIGWWNNDIGGFDEGHRADPEFHELLVRWFEFGVCPPICRLHGVRVPNGVPFSAPDGEVDYGAELFHVFTDTGGDNEVWSYTPELLAIFERLLQVREALRPYLAGLFADYARTGCPPMRPLPFVYPDQPALGGQGAYMLGPDLLVAPVTEPGARTPTVRLPAGEDWVHVWTGSPHPGGAAAAVPCPLGEVPVFCRAPAVARLGTVFATPHAAPADGPAG